MQLICILKKQRLGFLDFQDHVEDFLEVFNLKLCYIETHFFIFEPLV